MVTVKRVLSRTGKADKGRQKEDAHEEFSSTGNVADDFGMDRVESKQDADDKLRQNIRRRQNVRRGVRYQGGNQAMQSDIDGVK